MTNQPSTVMYYPGYSQEQVQQNLKVKTITAITNSSPMVVTTLDHHHYPPGVNVSFLIPRQFGMYQLNTLNGQVIAVTSNTLTIAIDSLPFAEFAYPGDLPTAYTPPSVVPNASGGYLPPVPLPYGNQDSFEGTIFNNGAIGDPIA